MREVVGGLHSSSRWIAYLLAVASALGYATLGVFGLYGYAEHLSTFTMLAWRFGGASVVFIVWAIAARSGRPGRKDVIALVAMGAVGYTAMSWLFLEGARLASVGLVSTALYTYPALLAVALAALSWEPLTRSKALALAATFLGVALTALTGQGDPGTGPAPLLGILAGFSTGVIYVAYILVGTPVLQRVTAPVASAVVSIGATGAFVLIGGIAGGLGPVPLADAWIILGLVGPATVLAIVGFFVAIQQIGAGRAAMLSNAEPVGAVLLGWLALRQALTPWQLAGVVLVIASAVFLRWERPQKARETVREESGLGN